MYVPEAFAEINLPVLHAAIDACGLAIFITATPDGPLASHVPMLLERGEGLLGTLHFHLARANPHAKSAANTQALVIFPGPDGYVSPAWYRSKAEHGRVVPTWNYVTVHATGRVETYCDEAGLHALVSRLTNHHEAARQKSPGPPPAWALASRRRPSTLRGCPITGHRRRAPADQRTPRQMEARPKPLAVGSIHLARRV